MNHEALLAAFLKVDDREKLASHFDCYTADELADLLKEKKAMGNCGPKPKKIKKSTMVKLSDEQIADRWGRELAQHDATSLKKLANPLIGAGSLLARGINYAGPLLGKGLSAIGKSTQLQRAGWGAAGGAALGMLRHLNKPVDPMTGRRQGSLVGSVAGHAIGGAGAGLAAKPVAQGLLGSKPLQGALSGNFRLPSWAQVAPGTRTAGKAGTRTARPTNLELLAPTMKPNRAAPGDMAVAQQQAAETAKQIARANIRTLRSQQTPSIPGAAPASAQAARGFFAPPNQGLSLARQQQIMQAQ